MQNFLTKLKNHRVEIIIGVGLISLYLFLRFSKVMALPIFTDEAIYIRWSQIAKQDAAWRFISLTDGKQPSFIWLTMIAMKIIHDPLLAGRVISIFAGLFNMIGLYFLGTELFKNKWIGIISAFLYLIFPMALVYDRMALYDTLVGTFAIWSLYLTVLLTRRVRLDIALILGMIMGGGVLTKTNAFFSIYLLPFALILFDWRRKDLQGKLVKWIGLSAVAVVITYALYSILRLSPFFYIIAEKNATFVYPFKEWIDHPFYFLVGNWKALWDWVTRYLTWPLLVLVPASFFINRIFTREKLLLFLWFIIPIISLAVFGRTIYPRFTFFMMLFLLPIISFSLFYIYEKLNKPYLFIVFCIAIFFPAFKADYFILTDITKAFIPVSDVRQYVLDWPAGGGIKESVEFFQKEAKKGKIYIGTQGIFGLLPYAFEIYLIQNPNVTIEGFWPVEDTIPQKVIDKSKKMPTYFVFYQPCSQCRFIGTAPVTWSSLELVYQFKKDYGKRYLSLYRVKP